jgi:phenylalanine-4-hydroxylase
VYQKKPEIKIALCFSSGPAMLYYTLNQTPAGEENLNKHVYQSKPLDASGKAHYSEVEKKTWSFLFRRQNELIQTRASKDFIRGVELLGFNDEVPQYQDISAILHAHTGWGVEPVPAVIQTQIFFDLLANKRFPAANFIRIPEEIDYIKEPDIFHEIYGHCPLITNAAFAEFMYQFGKLASTADKKVQRRLFRLFWFTVEFGLIKEDNQIKAYGGGILSSIAETVYSVESKIPSRIPMDPMIALRTPFRIDILQPEYFVIESYEDLFKLIDKNPIEMASQSLTMADFPAKFEPAEKKCKN